MAAPRRVTQKVDSSTGQPLNPDRTMTSLLDAQAKMEAEISQRHANDMNSDSWLSKNVRPMTLVFVIVCTMLLIFIDAGILDFSVKNEFISLLSTTLVAIISFYFGSRGFEKIKRK